MANIENQENLQIKVKNNKQQIDTTAKNQENLSVKVEDNKQQIDVIIKNQENLQTKIDAVASCPFPIGYGGFFQTDPNSIYSGTKWEQKKDVFILASGTAYPAGSTGGEASHMLTVDEMPSHYHTVYSEGSHTSTTKTNRIEYNSWNTSSTKATDGDNWGVKTMTTGGSKSHNNMPPFYSMPFWIRTA